MTVKAFFPLGHFYSPVVDPDEIRRDRDRVFSPTVPAEIDFNADAQLVLCGALAPYCASMAARNDRGRRYNPDNPQFGVGDAAVLHAMLRHFRPSRVTEIGSGHSSAVILDTCEGDLDDTKLVFADPYPEAVLGLLREGDARRCTVLAERLQDLPIAMFEELRAGDFLFIDSSHVVKTGSDVNHYLFNIFPKLASGVIIHIHDIFYPFEYPKGWVLDDNRSWNELYIVRAFLMHNRAYEILYFADYLHTLHRALVNSCVPQTSRNSGGSLWLRKV